MTDASIEAPGRVDAQRARVLEAAMLAISELGLEAVRMRDVSARAGMSPGHILYYFGSKDRLLIETLRWSEEDLGEHRRAALARVRGPERRLSRFVELYLPDGPVDPRWNLWAQVFAHRPSDEETLTVLARLEEAWTDDLAEIVREGVRQGVFEDVDAEDFATRSCSLMDGLSLDVLLSLPGRTRGRAIRLTLSSMRGELGLGPGSSA